MEVETLAPKSSCVTPSMREDSGIGYTIVACQAHLILYFRVTRLSALSMVAFGTAILIVPLLPYLQHVPNSGRLNSTLTSLGMIAIDVNCWKLVGVFRSSGSVRFVMEAEPKLRQFLRYGCEERNRNSKQSSPEVKIDEEVVAEYRISSATKFLPHDWC